MAKHAERIDRVDLARTVLAENPLFMIHMDMDFNCWIREGVPNGDGIPIATGQAVAKISDEVFHGLSQELEQDYCSEFYQARARPAKMK